MTARERAQVVELLRCAADVCAADAWTLFGPGTDAARWLCAPTNVRRLATIAVLRVGRGTGAKSADHYVAVMLEAAARVEEGTWP